MDSLRTSKLWYALQLRASVRMEEMQPKTKQGGGHPKSLKQFAKSIGKEESKLQDSS